jgi:glycerophosphoryl diester phosphodiesterase
MLDSFDRPLIIAHRGVKAFAPENTMSSFQMAVESKADGVEFDIKLTRDREIIIIHDLTVDRTTNGKGRVKDFSLAEIQKLDAGKFFSEKFIGEPIPLLSDVLKNLPSHFIINIEITNYGSLFDGLALKAVNLVKELDLEKQVIFSSFSPTNLLITKKNAPEIPVAILANAGLSGWISRSNLMSGISPQYVHPYFSDVNKNFVDRQHDKGRKVNVWTVNDPGEIVRLANIKVDGIITDDPLLARKTLGVE